DFDTMYALASDAADVLNRITDEQVRRDVREHLVRPPLSGTVKFDDAGKDSLRLYFDLANAKVIPDCMKHDEAVRTTRGKVEDLWDKGLFDWEEGWLAPLGRLMGLTNKSTVSSWGMALGLVIAAILFLVLAVVLTVLCLVVLARGKKPEIAAYILFPVVLLLATGGLYVFLVLWSSGWNWNALWTLGFQGKEFAMSFAMGLVVLLLGIEWLMRKLSRLAGGPPPMAAPLVPTLCVGTHVRTLCVAAVMPRRNVLLSRGRLPTTQSVEDVRSHAERGNEDAEDDLDRNHPLTVLPP